MEKGQWLKECEVCNVGLVNEMERLMANGCSQRAAAKELVQQQEERLGTVIYPENAIRQRYMYHTNKKKEKDKVVQFEPPSGHDELPVDPSGEDEMSESGSSSDGPLTELTSQDSEQPPRPTEDAIQNTEVVQFEPTDYDPPEDSQTCTFGGLNDPGDERCFVEVHQHLVLALEMVKKWRETRQENYLAKANGFEAEGLEVAEIVDRIGLPDDWRRPRISAELFEEIIKKIEDINRKIRLPFKRILEGQ